MIINVGRELDCITFEKIEDWEGHVENFSSIIFKLTFYDKLHFSEDKVSKLIRAVPQRFAPTAMVAESNGVPFQN